MNEKIIEQIEKEKELILKYDYESYNYMLSIYAFIINYYQEHLNLYYNFNIDDSNKNDFHSMFRTFQFRIEPFRESDSYDPNMFPYLEEFYQTISKEVLSIRKEMKK